ncbi:uncharacterized protein METZ01_LOCUS350068 [marine metagenome]|uniref:Transcription factor zinc-finger domain-containing protein n=1 Tax=marine metagenome TaxID=408172 RepID=A0A382RHM3_9ZZZZ
MEKVSIHEIELDRCNSCNGIWFDEYWTLETLKIRF